MYICVIKLSPWHRVLMYTRGVLFVLWLNLHFFFVRSCIMKPEHATRAECSSLIISEGFSCATTYIFNGYKTRARG